MVGLTFGRIFCQNVKFYALICPFTKQPGLSGPDITNAPLARVLDFNSAESVRDAIPTAP